MLELSSTWEVDQMPHSVEKSFSKKSLVVDILIIDTSQVADFIEVKRLPSFGLNQLPNIDLELLLDHPGFETSGSGKTSQ